MTKSTRKRPHPIVPMLACGIATVIALGLAELTVRMLAGPSPVFGRIAFQTEDGTPVADYAEGVAKGLIVRVPGQVPRDIPRERGMFKPGVSFYITYTDNEVLKRDWLDEQSRVHNRINSAGIREREELTAPKPANQRRIVCIGDSFTFGWGIPEAQNWVRLLEDDLRNGSQGKDGLDVRTVNCGAAGSVCIDEYVAGLKNRFQAFEPDAVILTICLNDLFGSDGLSVIGPSPNTGLRLLDLALAAAGHGPLALDPDRDWVGELLAMPKVYDDGQLNPRFGADKPFEAMWSQGVPQKSLREAKAWCEQRQIPFLVVIWPFLQGLGEGRYYPFQKMHDLVAADCKQAGIPLLDVLPALKGTNSEDLWVTPADPHPNPLAQRLTLPLISEFVRSHINR